MYPTFRSITKCSLLKLLCTLARLCEGTPLQPLQLDFFRIYFPFNPLSLLPFLTFSGQGKKGIGAHIPWARSAPQPAHPQHIPPLNTSHLSPAKVTSKSAPRHFVSSRADEGTFTLHFTKYFLCALTLLLRCYSCDPSWSFYPPGAVTWTTRYLE